MHGTHWSGESGGVSRNGRVSIQYPPWWPPHDHPLTNTTSIFDGIILAGSGYFAVCLLISFMRLIFSKLRHLLWLPSESIFVRWSTACASYILCSSTLVVGSDWNLILVMSYGVSRSERIYWSQLRFLNYFYGWYTGKTVHMKHKLETYISEISIDAFDSSLLHSSSKNSIRAHLLHSKCNVVRASMFVCSCAESIKWRKAFRYRWSVEAQTRYPSF